jgi:hypothetical protein
MSNCQSISIIASENVTILPPSGSDELVTLTISDSTQTQTYSDNELTLINPITTSSLFNPAEDYIEFTIYDSNGNHLKTEFNYDRFKILQDFGNLAAGLVSNLLIDVISDLIFQGLDFGKYNTSYNFLHNELGSSSDNRTYSIKEISSNRTEIRLITTEYSNSELSELVNSFSSSLSLGDYFDNFYLNFGYNYLLIANNILLDTTSDPHTVLIKLYEPLPSDISINDKLWIVTKKANTLSLNVNLPLVPIAEEVIHPKLKGPNFNIDLKNQINQSTPLKSYSDLINVPLTSSYNQLQNLLNQKGIKINVDYTNFNNFTHFSSAKTRLENFYYKVSLIENYNNELSLLNSITGSTSSSLQVSSSKAVLEYNIQDIITNFDGFDYFLYYTSNSSAWPKQNGEPPYILYSTGSSQVLNWYGSDIINNPYYGGQILSASDYDRENQENLLKTIPEFLRDDPSNSQYELFIEMIAHHFDNIWLYIKDVTNKFDNDNRLSYGVSKDLVAQILRDFGIKLYQNNFSSDDLYSAFLGINASGSLLPPTGSEYIENYITASNEALPLDDVNKEIYKRIYHNLPFLLKKKGTIEGLRALITCYGIPDTILRISEFGGKDKTNFNDWDYFYRRYSKAFQTKGVDTAYISFPWLPLKTHQQANNEWKVPDTLLFRFKTSGIPSSSHFSQSLWLLGSSNNLDTTSSFNAGLFLFYTGSGALTSGSYSGSIPSESKYNGDLTLYISGANGTYLSCSVNLPFYNNDWWSVMVRRSPSININETGSSDVVYSLYTKNKIYEGWDGDKIGYQASSSIINTSSLSSSINYSWATFTSSSAINTGSTSTILQSGASLGSRFGYTGFTKSDGIKILTTGSIYFTGSFQEIRAYSVPLTEEVFNDYVMNPESVEGLALTGSNSSFSILQFRAPLGNELELPTNNTQSAPNVYQVFTSLHPSITGSNINLITASFVISNPTDNPSNLYPSQSSYFIRDNQESPSDLGNYLIDNEEIYYLDQPAVGIRNRITDKIRIESSSLPSGNTLTPYINVQQKYPQSESYTRDVNYLEVAFSPQNEINDDISSTLGYFNIGEYIGDPRQISESSTSYRDLNKIRDEYFQKYFSKYDVKDFIRIIKYFDNSLFKMIKDFVPARTGVSTGIVIKQHLLERNKHRPPQVSQENITYTGSIKSNQIWDPINETTYISNSLIETFKGETGGVFETYAGLGTNPEGQSQGYSNNIHPEVTQSWFELILGPGGGVFITKSTQDEFYNGELSGSRYVVTNGELNPNNPYLDYIGITANYKLKFYGGYEDMFVPIDLFLDEATTGSLGYAYLYYDTGSVFNPLNI